MCAKFDGYAAFVVCEKRRKKKQRKKLNQSYLKNAWSNLGIRTMKLEDISILKIVLFCKELVYMKIALMFFLLH